MFWRFSIRKPQSNRLNGPSNVYISIEVSHVKCILEIFKLTYQINKEKYIFLELQLVRKLLIKLDQMTKHLTEWRKLDHRGTRRSSTAPAMAPEIQNQKLIENISVRLSVTYGSGFFL